MRLQLQTAIVGDRDLALQYEERGRRAGAKAALLAGQHGFGGLTRRTRGAQSGERALIGLQRVAHFDGDPLDRGSLLHLRDVLLLLRDR